MRHRNRAFLVTVLATFLESCSWVLGRPGSRHPDSVPSGDHHRGRPVAAGRETSLVTIVFNTPVTGFDNADLTVANGTLSSVSSSDGGTTWTATLTPTAGITDAANVITLDNTGVSAVGGSSGTGTSTSTTTRSTRSGRPPPSSWPTTPSGSGTPHW